MTYSRLFLAAALATTAASAQTIITEAKRNFTINAAIADTQNPPVSFLQTISDSAIVSLTQVEVGLKLAGTTPGSGFASEMFVSLNRNLSTTSVLLNQVGINGNGPVGQGYDGWNVTFKDNAEDGDVHVATQGSGTLVDDWAPDGRSAATDAARPLLLALFSGGAANADWRLNVADLAPGGIMTLESWSLTFTGLTAVPEPPAYAALAGLGLVAFGAWRRLRK